MDDFKNKLDILKQKLNIKSPKDILGEDYNSNKLLLVQWLLLSEPKRAVTAIKKMLKK